MKTTYNILIAVLLMLLTTNLNAQDLETDSLKKLYIPSNVRLQYAGNIGMFSFGPSWSFFKNRVDFEYSIGFVPKFNAKQPIYITAIKGIYTPKLDFKIKKVIIKPLSVGLVFSYTFGKRFSKYQDTNKYPKGYYWWNTSYRFGLLYQAEVYTNINHKQIKGLSFYLEVSIWDLDIYSYTGNSNYSHLSLWDITTLGIGTKIFF
ncbi:MAG: hypothetical protein IIA88_07330 [Bacteroidetes bacterium]|nr:hypothetical protein [Bacteroidota bacterium]